jgi:hypothetical protein
MTRGAGFTSADVDVGITRDSKFRRLARLHPDLIAVAFTGYMGILTDSWGTGERRTAADAWPQIIPWSDAAVDALFECELLDKFHRVPITTWRGWFGAAAARREKRRFSGSIGGKQKASNARALLQQSPSDALPVPPSSDPTINPKSRRAGLREDHDNPRSKGASSRQRGDNPRAKGTNPRANGDAPRQREDAVKAGLLAAFKAIGGAKEMPAGLRGEDDFSREPLPEPDEPDATDTDYIGGTR